MGKEKKCTLYKKYTSEKKCKSGKYQVWNAFLI